MIDIATVAVIALPSFAMGAFLAHTLLPAKGEGSPNVCGDALTIERLTDELREAHTTVAELLAENARLRNVIDITTMNRAQSSLGIDMAEKSARLDKDGPQNPEHMIDQLAWWQDVYHTLAERNKATEAENRDLHIDIEAKRKRLADAGLQSAGGCDVA